MLSTKSTFAALGIYKKHTLRITEIDHEGFDLRTLEISFLCLPNTPFQNNKEMMDFVFDEANKLLEKSNLKRPPEIIRIHVRSANKKTRIKAIRAITGEELSVKMNKDIYTPLKKILLGAGLAVSQCKGIFGSDISADEEPSTRYIDKIRFELPTVTQETGTQTDDALFTPKISEEIKSISPAITEDFDPAKIVFHM